MGIALWTVCAVLLFFIIRAISAGRPAPWVGEFIGVLIAALLLGAVATALDFGGWKEPDWRAGLFVFSGSAAVAAILRLLRMPSRMHS